ncbi:hypothetical protein BHQ17_04515 [Mycolicibacterium holsaticum]|uniref:Uncharacterized protein n=1 Tax=Mycolicibacterium holsaticum TaxID=152142 RepID=A0A1E3S0E1_9MYCO|nr:hypothetical protein BHQ17_04515 [Mycolicibacterium holsaticum]
MRGFPTTDFAAHLPVELEVRGRLRSSVPGRFWFCEVVPAVVCTLAEGVERDHIHPDLLNADRTSVTVSAVVVSPAASNRVLQPGLVDFAVHVAAVLAPGMAESGQMDPDLVGYLGCGIIDDASVAGGIRTALLQKMQALPHQG